MTKLSHYLCLADITVIHRGSTRLQDITTLVNTYLHRILAEACIFIRVDVARQWVKAPPSRAIIRVGIESQRAYTSSPEPNLSVGTRPSNPNPSGPHCCRHR
jgi:hypothetical protein